MTDYFRSSKDAEAAHPDLDRNAVIAKTERNGLAGKYFFDPTDQVQCQLKASSTATRCNEIHRRGWIMKGAGGIKGYVGKDCMRRHFGTDDAFLNAERSRINRSIAENDIRSRLSIQQNTEGMQSRIWAARDRCKALRSEIERVRREFPSLVLIRLDSMMRGQLSRSISIDFGRSIRDEDSDGNEFTRMSYVTGSIGAVAAPEGLNTFEAGKIASEVIAAQRALDGKSIENFRELRKAVQSLEQLGEVEARLERLATAFRTFVAPDNLAHLPWLCRNSEAQEMTMAAVLRLTGSPRTSYAQINAALRSARQEMLTAHRAEVMRVP